MKKYLLILTTLALLGGGCSKEEIPETTDGEGSVEFRTTTCSEVDSQTTRAQTSLPDNCKPSGNSFKLVVKGKEGTATAEYLAEYTTLSEYTAPFMPSGDYTATISYGDPQQEGSTAFCYQGALDFTILARKTIQKTITASLTNSVISLECGEWFKKYYSEAQFVKVDSTETTKTNTTTAFDLAFDKVETLTEEKENKAKSLNDKLAKGISIDLNDRIGFVKHLFGNSNEDYNRVLSQLNSFNNFYETKTFIDEMVKPDYNNWEGKDDYANRFMEIVEKKFL